MNDMIETTKAVGVLLAGIGLLLIGIAGIMWVTNNQVVQREFAKVFADQVSGSFSGVPGQPEPFAAQTSGGPETITLQGADGQPMVFHASEGNE